MTCTACGEHPKENTAKGFPKAVVEINNPETLVLLRKVVIPASMGDETAFPPAIGKYFNVLLHYEASGSNYLYSSDGIPTAIGANIPQEVLDRIEALEDGYDDLAEDYEQLQSQVGDVSEALSAETSARENADIGLQGQIDALTVSSGVIDVLGTYQDLQNYDTTHVKEDDIIKVLQDSTHSNAMSYYKWVITSNVGAWVYVGSEGPFYTKSEADVLLNSKQNTEDNSLDTTRKTIVGAINEVDSIAKGANQALSYNNYSTMVTAFNSLDDDVYKVGQNIYIVTTEVPDLWISGIESTSQTYTYTTDEAFTTELNTNGYVQVGYYKLSALETQKADLTNYVTFDDYATSTTAGVVITNSNFGVSTSSYTKNLTAVTKTYAQYQNGDNAMFVGKGTLENVITGKNLETSNNKVTSISSSSTDVQYPSAKCVYTNVLQLYNTKAEVINNTATGSIAHIEDGANNYSINSLITDINPIQNLHGYNSPWAGGEGENLLDPSKVSIITAYGLTITFSNNVFSISGTPTTQSTSLAFNFADYSDYSLSGKNYVVQALESSGTPIKSIYGFRTEQEKRIAIMFDSVANPTINTTFKLSVSTTSQTVWSPYENICPITGWTGTTISQSGEDTSSPTTRNISWQSEAGIIYGGTLDVISGVLTVTDQNIASYNGENLPSTWISDRDVYSVGETPTIGAQVVYKLATPATYQLPPQEIKTVLGINNIWSNTGNATVNYKADTKLYIDNKFQSLEDRLSLLEG